jgi:hypothetical protein
MAYTANEQQLYDHLKASIPSWFFQRSGSPEEIWGAYVKLYDAARNQVDAWRAQTMILAATGIWLDQHAADRGATRQASETDAALRTRIRVSEDAVTLAALKSHVQAIMTAAGVPSPLVGFLELRKDRAHLQEDQFVVQWGGTGAGQTRSGVFCTLATTTINPLLARDYLNRSVTITGGSGPDNVTTSISSATSSSITWINGAGTTNPSPVGLVVTMLPRKYAYVGRGYRMGQQRPLKLIIILPYGTPASARKAVDEYVRSHKAGGYAHVLEVRGVP